MFMGFRAYLSQCARICQRCQAEPQMAIFFFHLAWDRVFCWLQMGMAAPEDSLVSTSPLTTGLLGSVNYSVQLYMGSKHLNLYPHTCMAKASSPQHLSRPHAWVLMERGAQKETVRAVMEKVIKYRGTVAKVTDLAGGRVGRAGEYLSSFRNSISPPWKHEIYLAVESICLEIC